MSAARAPSAQDAPARSASAGRRDGSWVITLLATAASTYVLDAFAIAVGTLLAASGLLAGLDGPPLFGFLAATYAVWGAGLRVNLAANWSLLARTGVSTNVLSKAAHDIARARHAGPRMRRFAASSGYVLTELAKEVPYYASATGAVLLSNSVSAGDAIVFLAGTNLGAAVYEYGLARTTRAYLRRDTAATESAPRDTGRFRANESAPGASRDERQRRFHTPRARHEWADRAAYVLDPDGNNGEVVNHHRA